MKKFIISVAVLFATLTTFAQADYCPSLSETQSVLPATNNDEGINDSIDNLKSNSKTHTILRSKNGIEAKDSSALADALYYRFTLGNGIGKGYPMSMNDIGVGGSLEFAIQNRKGIYSVGFRGLTEFLIFGNSNVSNSVNSAEFTYGRVFRSDGLFTSISAGVGYITTEEKGEILSSVGFLFFPINTYEKIIRHTIGFPISAKMFWVPARWYGIGAEFYVNFNSRNTFYGINLCHQFGKLKAKKAGL